MATVLDDIVANFELLDEWDDRYRYLIELGRTLEPFPDALRSEDNKVRGCASQVWLHSAVVTAADGVPRLVFQGDSDAHIVRGLVALTIAAYSGRTAAQILETDAFGLFERLGLAAHLTPQRSNGVRAMIERIKADARGALAG